MYLSLSYRSNSVAPKWTRILQISANTKKEIKDMKRMAMVTGLKDALCICGAVQITKALKSQWGSLGAYACTCTKRIMILQCDTQR